MHPRRRPRLRRRFVHRPATPTLAVPSGASRRAACLSAAAVLVAGAVATAEHAVVSAVVLLTGIGVVLASLLTDAPSLDLPPGDDMTATGR